MTYATSVWTNAFRFWMEVNRWPQSQRWEENEVVSRDKYHKFRLFPGREPKQKRCVVLFPPYAGRHGNVTTRLIQRLQSLGYDVYVFEVLPTKWSNRRFSLKDMVQAGQDCYDFLGDDQERILFGVCQGMWLSFLVANGVKPPKAQFCFAGPADFSVGNGFIKNACEKLPAGWFSLASFASNGMQLGWSQWFNFASANPKAVFCDDYAKLWRRICEGDECKIAQWRSNHSWYCSPQNIGLWSFEAGDLFFKKNRLREMLDLTKFVWPMFLYAGGKDLITPWQQTFAAKRIWGLPSAAERFFPECGHTNVFNDNAPLDQVALDMEMVSGGIIPVDIFETFSKAA